MARKASQAPGGAHGNESKPGTGTSPGQAGTGTSPGQAGTGVSPAPAGGRVLLVVNRRARKGDSSLEPALEVLGTDSPAVLLSADEPETLPQRLQAALTGDVTRVVVAGGDGTINCALPALLAAGKPFGILPLGTANDLARTLAIPADPAAAAAVIRHGYTRRIDVGRVNGKPFLNAAGIGFSPQLHELPSRLKGALGALAYPIGILRRWRRHRPFKVTVRDERILVMRRVIQVTVANGRFYGGGMTAHEEARIDDGTLDLLLILPRPLWRLAWSALSLKRGVYSSNSPVMALRGRSFEVRTRRPRPVSADGEVATATPAVFEVAPRSLEVYVPDESHQG